MATSSTSDVDDSSRTVLREKELKIVLNELRARRDSNKLAGSAIVIHGPTGIGKTQFINRHLLRSLKDSKEFAALPWAMVNFDDDYANSQYRGPLRRGRLIIDLTLRLYESAGEKPSNDFWNTKGAWEEGAEVGVDKKLHDLEEELVGYFNTQAVPSLIYGPEHAPHPERPVLIILDTVEHVDDEFLNWIQNSLIDPTIRLGRVVWLLASRAAITPTALVEDAVQQHRLQRFGTRQIEQQVGGHEDIVPILEKFGQGHPEATSSLIKMVGQLEEQSQGHIDRSELERKHSDDLIRSLAQLLDRPRYLGELDPQLRAIIDLLSPLRMFDLSVLTDLLTRFLPEYLGRSQVFFDPLIVARQLLASRLVVWDKKRRGYVFEEPLRRIIVQVFEHDHPELYRHVHSWALEQYQDWFKRKPRKRLDSLVEAFYHRAVIARQWEYDADATGVLLEMMENAVARLEETPDDDTRAALDELTNQIKGDVDLKRELGPGLERLIDYLEDKVELLAPATEPTEPVS